MTDPNTVVTECDLADAPEKVWKALTTPELLEKWLPEARACEVLATEPNRLLRCRWPAGAEDRDESGARLDSVVTFELTDTPAGGTHLRIDHRVLVAAPVIALARVRKETPAAAAPVTTIMMMRRAA